MDSASRRPRWPLVIAALFFLHGVQAIAISVSRKASLQFLGDGIARIVVAAYAVLVWHYLAANRVIAWRLILIAILTGFVAYTSTAIDFMLSFDAWPWKLWCIVVLCVGLGFGWYYGLRRFLMNREQFIARSVSR